MMSVSFVWIRKKIQYSIHAGINAFVNHVVKDSEKKQDIKYAQSVEIEFKILSKSISDTKISKL